MADTDPFLIQEITQLADVLRAKFTPPEFIAGCQVKSVADINEYAANNGWVEAICGQHNLQRVRWKSSEAVVVDDYIDVLYFRDRRLFEAYGLGGSTAIPGSSGGWGFTNILRVDPTSPDADATTVAGGETAAAAGQALAVGLATYNETVVVSKQLTIAGVADARPTITTSTTDATTVTVDTTAAGSELSDLIITNTSNAGAGHGATCVSIAADNVTLRRLKLRKTTGSTTSAVGLSLGAIVDGLLIDQPDIEVTSGLISNFAAVLTGSNTSGKTVTVRGGRLKGNIYIDQVGLTINLENPVIDGTITVVNGTLTGKATDTKGRDCGKVIKNTSGATVARGDVGYINEDGEFKTTTTASDSVNWHVVTVGGPNNSLIFAKNTGNATVNYTGSAPAAGDYLVTSTSAGDAQLQTTMRSEIFAVCLAAGSGGTVEALLLTGRATVLKTDAQFFYGAGGASDSDFVATIASLPGGANLTYNAPSSGAENTIAPWAILGTFNAKLVLHNTTRGDSALISAVTVGTNTITLTANVPVGWQVNDIITARSQTNTSAFNVNSRYFDFDFSGMTSRPATAVAILLDTSIADSGGGGGQVSYHPFEVYTQSKNFQRWTQVATQRYLAPLTLPIIESKITFAWDATGSGTASIFLSHVGWIVATP